MVIQVRHGENLGETRPWGAGERDSVWVVVTQAVGRAEPQLSDLGGHLPSAGLTLPVCDLGVARGAAVSLSHATAHGTGSVAAGHTADSQTAGERVGL